MSTIASPRQSLTISSRRDSTSTDNTHRSASTSRTPAPVNGSLRRNRAALRDYYGLKAAQQGSDTPSPAAADAEDESELDREGFDAEHYVKELLANEGLENILRTEAILISETRNLDGEKKALVYDNYSKLIAATETIRKMRTNMDPLSPTTSNLTPAIGHIAESATTLSESLKRQHSAASSEINGDRAKQVETVRWVLQSPRRLGQFVKTGQLSEAETEWTQVQTLLDHWQGVKGVDAVRKACLAALSKDKT